MDWREEVAALRILLCQRVRAQYRPAYLAEMVRRRVPARRRTRWSRRLWVKSAASMASAAPTARGGRSAGHAGYCPEPSRRYALGRHNYGRPVLDLK